MCDVHPLLPGPSCVVGRESKEKLEGKVAKMIQDSTVGPEWKYMHRAAQAQNWKLTVKKEHRKDPEEADVHHTFLSEDGREIDFEGEEGIKKWNRIDGDKKISRQIPKRTYQVMELVDRERGKYEKKVTKLLRIQLEEQSRPCIQREESQRPDE